MTSERPVDWREREGALDPARSFIVQAPAGSGKTGLLTQRFLRLLATVEQPEEIVAITFTRKAAAEMRGRILQALAAARDNEAGPAAGEAYARQTWALARAALAQSRARGWRLLENPQRLRVRTIDSLCQYLVRQMPLAAGFGDPPGIEEDATGLHAAAARSVLAELESEGDLTEALARLLGELDNRVESVQQLVADMLGRREQWLRHIFAPTASEDGGRAAIEQVLRGVVERQLVRLQLAFPAAAANALPALIRYAAENLGEPTGARDALATCRDLQALPPASASALPAWNALADWLLTQKGEFRKSVTVAQGFPPGRGAPAEAKQAMLELLDDLRPEAGLAALLHGLRGLPSPVYGDAEWALIQALFTVLKGAVAHLGLIFLEQGKVDFSEAALAAQRALGAADEPSDLALRLDHQVRHLLVDEFQDTSRSQHDLLQLLTAGWQAGDGRSVFLVGDPMQSIYRFRQAEVGLFLDAWQGRLGEVALQPLRLAVNFRSRPAVIDWVNRHFAQVLPAQGDKELGAVPYAPSQPFGGADAGSAAVGVSLHPFDARDDAVETARIVEIVRQAGADSPDQTTAVLVRSKAHLDLLIVALRAAGLRFQAVEIGALQHRPAVMDLLSLTLALLHPADRLHWLAVLHGPLGGLGLADLHGLAGGDGAEPGRDAGGTIPALLADPARRAVLSADGRARCERVGRVLAAAQEHRERAPLRDWVEGVWLALGGPLCWPDEGAAEDVEVYLQFLQELGERGPVTPERVRDGVQALFALPDPLADAQLQLMTIHKAKGLEFDTVILPGLGRPPRGESRKLLYWLETTAEDGRAELFFGPVKSAHSGTEPPTSAYIKGLEAEMGRLENGRLLYVAATRARRRLHLFGHAARKADGSCAPDGASLLACLWPAVRGAWDDLPARLQPEPGTGVGESPAAYRANGGAPRSCVPAGWSCPAPPGAAGLASAPLEIGEERITYAWAGDTARAVGTVVHRFLQRLAESGADGAATVGLAALPGFEAAARRLLRHEGLPERDLGAALQRVRGALERSLADPRGQWLLSPDHAEARSELPLSVVVEGRVRRIVVDRCFVDAGGTRWIVDYKTGTHEGGDVEGFLDREQARYRAQLAAYAAAFRALEDRPVRAALYYPLVEGGWRELDV
jgi:ATP-dependent exoDNAse (exonuclease V) beta subunit